MEQGHYSIEAAGAAQAHHITGSHDHGMQEVGPVTVHHSLYADEKKLLRPFSNHNASLLRQQPGAYADELMCFDVLACQSGRLS